MDDQLGQSAEDSPGQCLTAPAQEAPGEKLPLPASLPTKSTSMIKNVLNHQIGNTNQNRNLEPENQTLL